MKSHWLLYFLSILITVNQMSYPWDVIKLRGEVIIWWGRLEISIVRA